MYKEILCLSLPSGKKPQRERLPVLQIPDFIKRVNPRHCELMIGQDTWTESHFLMLADYDLWLDLDAANKNNRTVIENLRDSMPVCLNLLDVLDRDYGLGADQLRIYFSGRGGFHILLPFKLTELTKPQVVHERVKLFVQNLAERIRKLGIPGAHLDSQLYSNKHVIRLPGSRHPSGLSKVLVSRDELQLPPRRLELVLDKRHRTAQGALSLDWLVAKQINEAFSRLVLNTSVQILAIPQAAVQNWNIGFLNDNQPDIRCLTWFIQPQPSGKSGQFNKARMFLISWLKTLLIPNEIGLCVVRDFTERFSSAGKVSSAKRKERLAEVESSLASIYRSDRPQYNYNIQGHCTTFLIGILDGAVPSLFCSGCPHYYPDARPEFSAE